MCVILELYSVVFIQIFFIFSLFIFSVKKV